MILFQRELRSPSRALTFTGIYLRIPGKAVSHWSLSVLLFINVLLPVVHLCLLILCLTFRWRGNLGCAIVFRGRFDPQRESHLLDSHVKFILTMQDQRVVFLVRDVKTQTLKLLVSWLLFWLLPSNKPIMVSYLRWSERWLVLLCVQEHNLLEIIFKSLTNPGDLIIDKVLILLLPHHGF